MQQTQQQQNFQQKNHLAKLSRSEVITESDASGSGDSETKEINDILDLSLIHI